MHILQWELSISQNLTHYTQIFIKDYQNLHTDHWDAECRDGLISPTTDGCGIAWNILAIVRSLGWKATQTHLQKLKEISCHWTCGCALCPPIRMACCLHSQRQWIWNACSTSCNRHLMTESDAWAQVRWGWVDDIKSDLVSLEAHFDKRDEHVYSQFTLCKKLLQKYFLCCACFAVTINIDGIEGYSDHLYVAHLLSYAELWVINSYLNNTRHSYCRYGLQGNPPLHNCLVSNSLILLPREFLHCCGSIMEVTIKSEVFGWTYCIASIKLSPIRMACFIALANHSTLRWLPQRLNKHLWSICRSSIGQLTLRRIARHPLSAKVSLRL